MSAEDIIKVAAVLAASLLLVYVIYDNSQRSDAKLLDQERHHENFYADSGVAASGPSGMSSGPAPLSAPASLAPKMGMGMGMNANQVRPVESSNRDGRDSVGAPSAPSAGPADCYPRDRLTAADLLPRDAVDSKWAQVNPAGQGDVKDQNFLTAGYHIGINTIGSSLRNANLQLRSEPPNPQNVVSPFLNTTINPDLNRKAFEIGGDF
jgi:hypothetical protein